MEEPLCAKSNGEISSSSLILQSRTQDSERGYAAQRHRVRQGSRGHWPLALSPVLSSTCINRKGSLPSPSRAYAVSGEGAGVLGVRRAAERFSLKREEQRGLGRFLNSLSRPNTHTNTRWQEFYFQMSLLRGAHCFPGDVWWRCPFLPASLAATRRLWLPLLPRAATARVPCDLYK